MKVALALSHGVTDSGVSIALDVLRAANSLSRHLGRRPPFSVTMCSHDGRPVRAASGLRLGGLATFGAAHAADALIVPGVWLELEAEAASWLADRALGRLADLSARAHRRGALVLGSCTGTFALAKAGLLDGLEATTSWWLAGALRRAFPRVLVDPSRALIAHQRLATAGAVLAQADLSLHLVRMVAGPQTASLVTRYLLLDEHAAQAPYMASSQLVGDDRLLRHAERWIRDHLAQPIGVPALAKAVATSPRTLARRVQATLGISPGRWIRRLRVEETARLLETTTLSMEEVTERVGFGSTATLRREVRLQLKRSPRELRAAAQARAERGRSVSPARARRAGGVP